MKKLCDWLKQRQEAELSDLPQAFIAKWLPVISETTFHIKAPDVVRLLSPVVSQCGVKSASCSVSYKNKVHSNYVV